MPHLEYKLLLCEPKIEFKPLNPNIKIQILNLLSLYVFSGSSGENLLKYQLDASCVIMSLILMNTLFYKAVILQGEIWLWSLLGLKGLRSCRRKSPRNRPSCSFLLARLSFLRIRVRESQCFLNCSVGISEKGLQPTAIVLNIYFKH